MMISESQRHPSLPLACQPLPLLGRLKQGSAFCGSTCPRRGQAVLFGSVAESVGEQLRHAICLTSTCMSSALPGSVAWPHDKYSHYWSRPDKCRRRETPERRRLDQADGDRQEAIPVSGLDACGKLGKAFHFSFGLRASGPYPCLYRSLSSHSMPGVRAVN